METPGPYYTHADLIRNALSKHPRTRAEIISLTDLTRTELSKAIYQLKKQGDVIEEGDRLMLTKAPETAQDASESPKPDMGSTPEPERAKEPIPAIYESRPVDALEAVNALADEYRSVVAALLATRKENEQLRETVSSRDEEWDALVAEAVAYRKLKEKLRGMLDAE